MRQSLQRIPYCTNLSRGGMDTDEVVEMSLGGAHLDAQPESLQTNTYEKANRTVKIFNNFT
jgi:hypothetical protein